MTDMNIDELEQLAKAATPGPWFAFPDAVAKGSPPEECECSGRQWFGCKHSSEVELVALTDDCSLNEEYDAQYIAAASPDVVLALIERLRQATDLLRECFAYAGEVEHAMAPWIASRPSMASLPRTQDERIGLGTQIRELLDAT